MGKARALPKSLRAGMKAAKKLVEELTQPRAEVRVLITEHRKGKLTRLNRTAVIPGKFTVLVNAINEAINRFIMDEPFVTRSHVNEIPADNPKVISMERWKVKKGKKK